jgi:hypothetical protein
MLLLKIVWKAKKLNAYLTKKIKSFQMQLTFTPTGIWIFKRGTAHDKKINKGLTYDEVFLQAREFAFNNEREKARLLCIIYLMSFPQLFNPQRTNTSMG